MRFILGLLSLPVFAAAIVFILQNRTQVTLSFWPFEGQATMPVSVLALGLLILGFLMGSAAAWMALARASFQLRRLRGQIARLEKEREDGTRCASRIGEATILYKGRYQPLSSVDAMAPSRSFFSRFLKGKRS